MLINKNTLNTLPEQVEENKQNIESLAEVIKPLYKANSSTMTPDDKSIALSNTTIPNESSTNALLLSENGILFDVVAIRESTVYISYMATIPAGPTGATGAQGPKGDTGATGSTGATGAQGVGIKDVEVTPTGSQENGDIAYNMEITLTDDSKINAGDFVSPQGPRGEVGPAGPIGPEGPVGPRGPAGPDGVTYREAFATETSYNVNDLVTYHGSTYICLEAYTSDGVTPDQDPTHWGIFAEGATGGGGITEIKVDNVSSLYQTILNNNVAYIKLQFKSSGMTNYITTKLEGESITTTTNSSYLVNPDSTPFYYLYLKQGHKTSSNVSQTYSNGNISLIVNHTAISNKVYFTKETISNTTNSITITRTQSQFDLTSSTAQLFNYFVGVY